MLEVADVFRLYGDAYLQRFGRKMPPSHRRALEDIRALRHDILEFSARVLATWSARWPAPSDCDRPTAIM